MADTEDAACFVTIASCDLADAEPVGPAFLHTWTLAAPPSSGLRVFVQTPQGLMPGVVVTVEEGPADPSPTPPPVARLAMLSEIDDAMHWREHFGREEAIRRAAAEADRLARAEAFDRESRRRVAFAADPDYVWLCTLARTAGIGLHPTDPRSDETVISPPTSGSAGYVVAGRHARTWWRAMKLAEAYRWPAADIIRLREIADHWFLLRDRPL
ncbi:hypothetical protein [Microbacterium sp. GXS0129]|uniref:hypothetical protein n=1 Tax=Microbacterium sp. GXS0129 TaxID=3377836 RepID=UPI00383A9A70